MALIEFEGWDTQVLTRPGWAISFPAFFTGRFSGSSAIRGSGNALSATYTLSSAITGTTICGVAFFTDSGTSAIINLKNSATSHIYVQWTGSTGRFQLFRGDGTLLATSTSTYSTGGAWRYVEISATVADSGGTVTVNIDSVTQMTYTGDTRNGATAQVDAITMISTTGQGVDDFYLCDGTGSAPYNSFLGDVRVQQLVPNAAGTYSQLTPTGSATNWQNVDEVPSSATDYNGSATIGQRDTYNMTNLATTSGQAYAVRVIAFAHKSDAGAAGFKLIQRLSGGTERLDTAASLSSTANTPIDGSLQVVDPSNAAWTISSVNAAEFGVEVA